MVSCWSLTICVQALTGIAEDDAANDDDDEDGVEVDDE
jgi:hypothetical protein